MLRFHPNPVLHKPEELIRLVPVQLFRVAAAFDQLQAPGPPAHLVQPFAVGMADNGVSGAVNQQDRHVDMPDTLNRFFLLQPGICLLYTSPSPRD